MKKWAELSRKFFGTLKYDYVIKTTEMFNFLTLINNSVTAGFTFLSIIISAFLLSRTINILRFLPIFVLQYIYKHLAYHLNIQ